MSGAASITVTPLRGYSWPIPANEYNSTVVPARHRVYRMAVTFL